MQGRFDYKRQRKKNQKATVITFPFSKGLEIPSHVKLHI